MPRQSRQPAAGSTKGSEPRGSLSPADWINLAIERLVDHGIDAVRVDDLARRLSVTRGSFYWHFKDRDDLLKSVLKTWRDAATEQIIQRFDTRHPDPRVLIKDLISLPFRGDRASRAANTELAIRAWARRDPMARQAVDEVDERRISYHAQVFSALGFPIPEARSRAFVLYAYEVAESLLSHQGTDAQKSQRRLLVEQLVLTHLPQENSSKPTRAVRALAGSRS
jgi:AcrR family transcriptional regulator